MKESEQMRRTLLVMAAVAAAGAIVLAVFSVQAAIAALAASWLLGLAWVVLWARSVSRKLNQVLADAHRASTRQERLAGHVRASRRSLRRLDAQSGRIAARVAEQRLQQQKTTDRTKVARRELYKVLVWVQRTPSVTHELGRVYERLVRHDRPMPELGDWAMSASTLIWLVDRIANSPVRTIVECGSGSSTIWFATALAQRGGEGKVVALESSAAYAETTRAELARYGLEDRAEVLHAPLVDTPGPEPGQPALVRPLRAPRPPAGRPAVRRRPGRRDRPPGPLPGLPAAGEPIERWRDRRPRRHGTAGRGRDREAVAAGVIRRSAAPRGAPPRSFGRLRYRARRSTGLRARLAALRSLRTGVITWWPTDDPFADQERDRTLRGWQR